MKKFLVSSAIVVALIVVGLVIMFIFLMAWSDEVTEEAEWKAYIRDNGCVVSIDDSWKTCWKCSLPREHEVCR